VISDGVKETWPSSETTGAFGKPWAYLFSFALQKGFEWGLVVSPVDSRVEKLRSVVCRPTELLPTGEDNTGEDWDRSSCPPAWPDCRSVILTDPIIFYAPSALVARLIACSSRIRFSYLKHVKLSERIAAANIFFMVLF
jgi:hypothetical protein